MNNLKTSQKMQSQKQLAFKIFSSKYLITVPSVLRLGCSVLLVTGVALILIYVSYINYWQKTIFRTQTVDFNILMNLLPIKLSIHLIQGNTDELQRTIDSNYGLFGIVVTNCKTIKEECPYQEITYISNGKLITTLNGEKKYKSKGNYAYNWQSSLSKKSLKGQLYGLLRNPAPLTQELEYKNPRYGSVTPTGRINSGIIIGRVYFIRNSLPPFSNEIIKWLKNPFSSSSAALSK